ncbi:MAG: sulfite exporter TauE/SafE family protein [Candidatus Aenigmarchaeota archaeon]|nr:sulfite exporter TauE/SafE family protein [Candidatus Aenigmarchaeota archaeon]
MDPSIILMLAILNFFLSFYSVIVGGGALVMVPLLVSVFGVPAQSAVAISRFYNVGTGGASLFEFTRGGKVNWRVGSSLAGCAIGGSLVGSFMVLSIDEFILKRMIAILIVAVLVIMLTNRKLGTIEVKKCGYVKNVTGCVMVFFAIMISTMVGGGGGIFISYILILLFGQTFIQSMGTRKVVTIAGLISSTIFFMIAGIIIYEIAIPLLITGAIGGWAGSKFAMKRGDKWIRIFFIVVVFGMAINMFIQL